MSSSKAGSSDISYEKATLGVAYVAMLVAAFGLYIMQPEAGAEKQSAETGESEKLRPVSQQRVDFDMFPGLYVLKTEVVSFEFSGENREFGRMLGGALEASVPDGRRMCLSAESGQYNIFSDGIAENCILNENRSFPGVIDVVQECSMSGFGSAQGMTLRMQGDVSTVAADLILSSEFEVAGDAAKAVLRSKFERVGDCDPDVPIGSTEPEPEPMPEHPSGLAPTFAPISVD